MGDLQVTAVPHILKPPVQSIAPEGYSLQQIIGNPHTHVKILVNGEEVPRDLWVDFYPEVGDVILIQAFPSDGGGENLRFLAQIAIVVAAFTIPGAIGIVNPLTASFVSTAVSLAGSLVVNSLIQPPQQPALGVRSANLTGVRNSLNPYGVIPRPFGRIRCFPVILGKPVTEIVGNDQYLRTLFCVGVGNFHISELKIGETLISNYVGLEVAVGNISTDSAYDGKLTGAVATSLYNRDVEEQFLTDTVTSTNGAVITTRTTVINTTEIGLDLTAPSGLRNIDDNGKTQSIGIIFKLEYRQVGGSAWFNVADLSNIRLSSSNISKVQTPNTVPKWQAFFSYQVGNKVVIPTHQNPNICFECSVQGSSSGNEPNWNLTVGATTIESTGVVWITRTLVSGTSFFIHGNTSDTLRCGVSWSVNLGQYDVRITPGLPYYDGNTGIPNNETYYALLSNKVRSLDIIWTSLRSWQVGSPVESKLLEVTSLVGMRIKATDQLNGVVDQFSCISNTKLRTFNGTSWTTEVITRSPAWAFVEALTGVSNPIPLPLSAINAIEIKAWADDCIAKGFYYDSRGDKDLTVLELVREITAAGRATLTIKGGLYTVVRDLPAQIPVQMFTPKNSWGFSAAKNFPNIPHALKIRFINPFSWVNDEVIVYDDGYSFTNATKFETLDFGDLTEYSHVWKLGRYHLAALRLRPELYTLSTDIENLACHRGDVIAAANDVASWGLFQGRIKSIVLNGAGQIISFISDEELILDTNNTHVVRVRRKTGTQVVQTILVTVAGLTNQVTFTSPVSGIDVGDLFVLGLQTREVALLKIIKIEPGVDLSAKLTLVDVGDDIHTADTQTIPPFDSKITRPLTLEQIVPPTPTIINIQSDENVLTEDIDGSLRVRILVTFGFKSQIGLPSVKVKVRYKEVGLQNPYKFSEEVPAEGSQINIFNVKDKQAYEIWISSSTNTRASRWSDVYTHTVIGKSTKPQKVTGFIVGQNGPVAVASWNPVKIRDLLGYDLRYNPKNHNFLSLAEEWRSATPITISTTGTTISTISVPPGDWIFYIKALDTANPVNESIEPAFASLTIQNIYDVIQRQEFDPRWTGFLTNFKKHWTGKLVPDSTKAANLHTKAELFEQYCPYAYTLCTYESKVVDLDLISTVRVWGDITSGLGRSAVGVANPTFKISYSNVYDSGYTSYQGWTLSKATFRYIKFKLELDTTTGKSYVSKFSATLDTEEVKYSGLNVTIPVGGFYIAFPQKYHKVPIVDVYNFSPANLKAAAYNVTVEGFFCRIYTSGGTEVGGILDKWVSTGV